jgi:hypothetical protein
VSNSGIGIRFSGKVDLDRLGHGGDIDDLTCGKGAPGDVVCGMRLDEVLSPGDGVEYRDWNDAGRVIWILSSKPNELVS